VSAWEAGLAAMLVVGLLWLLVAYHQRDRWRERALSAEGLLGRLGWEKRGFFGWQKEG